MYIVSSSHSINCSIIELIILFFFVLSGNSECVGSITTAVFFAVSLIVCVTTFTIVIIILQYGKKLKMKISSHRLVHRTAEESNYEDVGNKLPQHEASVVSSNITINIAYGKPSIVAAPDT